MKLTGLLAAATIAAGGAIVMAAASPDAGRTCGTQVPLIQMTSAAW
jgi:hypothetical protein